MVASPEQQRFGQDKLDTLPQYCLDCDVRFACHGGCPKDRFISTPTGEPGLNYLCPGHQAFFRHVDQPMRRMAELLGARRAPSEIVQDYAAAGEPATSPAPAAAPASGSTATARCRPARRGSAGTARGALWDPRGW